MTYSTESLGDAGDHGISSFLKYGSLKPRRCISGRQRGGSRFQLDEEEDGTWEEGGDVDVRGEEEEDAAARCGGKRQRWRGRGVGREEEAGGRAASALTKKAVGGSVGGAGSLWRLSWYRFSYDGQQFDVRRFF
jgi:hypothetical protein